MKNKIIGKLALLLLLISSNCPKDHPKPEPLGIFACVERDSEELSLDQFNALRTLTFQEYNLASGRYIPSSWKDLDRASGYSTLAWGEDESVEIPVCWMSETYYAGDQKYRNVVRASVERTWEVALANTNIDGSMSTVKFTGWQECVGSPTGTIKIYVEDTGPRVTSAGTLLGLSSQFMYLNFTYKYWSDVCSESESDKLECIGSIAVHEFGHALGLAHEQNRHDTAEYADDYKLTCTDADRQGGNGDLNLGPWDPDSVMNYCNRVWNNAGDLSKLDVAGIKNFYYPKNADEICTDEDSYIEAFENY